MKVDDRGRAELLQEIARLLECSVEAFKKDEAGMGHLSELLTLWPDLTEQDRIAITGFAKASIARRAGRRRS